jgi:hypothetical protein
MELQIADFRLQIPIYDWILIPNPICTLQSDI